MTFAVHTLQMSMKWSCQGVNPYNTVRPPYISLTHSYRTTEQYWYINPVFPLESVIMGFNIFSIILFLIASLLEPESSDPVSNGMVEQLQLIQPQFVDRYWLTLALLFICLERKRIWGIIEGMLKFLQCSDPKGARNWVTQMDAHGACMMHAFFLNLFLWSSVQLAD